MFSWISDNWFSALQTLGITAGFCFNAYSLLISSRIRKVDTLINITQQHRAIWLKFFDSPNLKRILTAHVDLVKHPMTDDEAMFINLIILHLTTVLIAVKKKVIPTPAGQDDDIREFFSLPIPNAAWNQSKAIHAPDTIRHIDGLLRKDTK